MPGWYTVAGGEFYFVAKTGSGENLYRVDTSGDSPSPVKVHDANGISPDHLIALDGEVYFDARVGSDSDEELWRTDGPDAITRVAEINTDTGSSGSAEIIAPEVLDGELLFSATDGDTGRELWKHDPADGTEQVKDINDGGDSSPLDLFAIE